MVSSYIGILYSSAFLIIISAHTKASSIHMFMIFDSQIVRNTMIPNKKSTEWPDAIMEERSLWSLWSKLGTYVTDESLSNYNDFVVYFHSTSFVNQYFSWRVLFERLNPIFL